MLSQIVSQSERRVKSSLKFLHLIPLAVSSKEIFYSDQETTFWRQMDGEKRVNSENQNQRCPFHEFLEISATWEELENPDVDKSFWSRNRERFSTPWGMCSSLRKSMTSLP